MKKRTGFLLYIVLSLFVFFMMESFVSDAMIAKGIETIVSYLPLRQEMQKEEEEIQLDEGTHEEQVIYDKVFYPYYDMLNEQERILYAEICANAQAYNDTFEPQVELDHDSIHRVLEAVYYDHPEYFWMNTGYSYKYTEEDICVEITLEFNETIENIEREKEEFYQSAGEILLRASELQTDYEKEKYVHDVLVEMVDYDVDAGMNQSAYSALVNHDSVCAGYARSFQYLLQQLGIPVYYVAGISQDSEHAWNMVLLEDGYYYVDVTWDDASGQTYMFFNLNEDEIVQSHEKRGMSASLPECHGTMYSHLENSFLPRP